MKDDGRWEMGDGRWNVPLGFGDQDEKYDKIGSDRRNGFGRVT